MSKYYTTIDGLLGTTLTALEDGAFDDHDPF